MTSKPSPNESQYDSSAQFRREMYIAAERIVGVRMHPGEEFGIVAATGLVILGSALGALQVMVSSSAPTALAVWIPYIIWILWYIRRRNRGARLIVEQRLCLACGYPLLHHPLDEHGTGTCPECGRQFCIGEYLRPGDAPQG